MKQRLSLPCISWIELLIDPNCDWVLVHCSATLVWYTVCKTGCETGCLTVCTSHKDLLFLNNASLTNTKIGLHTLTTRLVVPLCFNAESLGWQEQVKLWTFSYRLFSLSWLDVALVNSHEINPKHNEHISSMFISHFRHNDSDFSKTNKLSPVNLIHFPNFYVFHVS